MGRDCVGVELLYNPVHRKFNQSWSYDAVEKTAPSRRGPQEPRLSSWRSDELQIRCGRENQYQAEWAPGHRLSRPGEWERNTVMAIGVGVNMLQFYSVSNSFSHTSISNKVRGIFFKNFVARLYCVVVMNLHMSMQHN